MSVGWFVGVADADAYFADERLVSDYWDALVESADADKIRVIKNAYNRLYHDERWDLPTYADATVAQLVKLRIANGEMAYYLAVHLADEDMRKGLQAQGVTEAGIVKEKYSEGSLYALPVPPFVIAMLEPWAVSPTCAGVIELTRDEEESI